MKLPNIFIYILVALLHVSLWTWVNKPFNPVSTQYPFDSLSFNPYSRNQNPFDNPTFDLKQLDSDLSMLKGKTKTVRTYTSLNGLEALPPIAQQYGINLTYTAWLDSRDPFNKNQQQVDSIVGLAKSNRNVNMVIIGNETQLHETVSETELIGYLDNVRKKLKKYHTPISTAEPWDYWLNHPDLANHVDFIAIHILPYWVGVPVDDAAQYVLDKYKVLKQTFPKKKVFIMETGWPSEGPQRGAAVPSLANQALFIRSFVRLAKQDKINYNIIEAFDQPWKKVFEGRTGEHWGLMNADRHDKFPLDGPVIIDPNWKFWVFASVIFGVVMAALFLRPRSNIRYIVRIGTIILVELIIVYVVALARDMADEYLSPGEIIFWALLITGQFFLALIFLTDTSEIADVVGNKELKNRYLPWLLTTSDEPFVSIHVACCNEPPQLVTAMLESLSRLNYSNFEVLVIDNNTDDPANWEPIHEHCKKLGSRFRFFTLGKHPGFKGGALNFALSVTDERAEVVGVIDVDYIVDSNWLSATAPYFEDPEVGVVQVPQEHRDWQGHLFQRMANDEFSGFFRIGMVQRNEDNAIIQHGTMTLIRKQTLQQLQGWAEWCICEDTELGLRIQNEGKKILYVDYAFGWGLVPDNFESYSKQRFRWAYGGMSIMRRHFKKIMGWEGGLTRAQRYHYFDGWLVWIGDALHLMFTLCAIFWDTVIFSDPDFTDFPKPVFLYPVIALFFVRTGGILLTYRSRVKIGLKRTTLAMLAGGALTHTIAKAVIRGLFTSSLPFNRTSKTRTKNHLWESLFAVWEEAVLASALIGFAVWILHYYGLVNQQAVLWMVVTILHATPYLAAIITAALSGFSSSAESKGT